MIPGILRTKSKDSEDSPSIEPRSNTKTRKKQNVDVVDDMTLPSQKYLFCIYSPIVFVVSEATSTDETKEFYQSVWKSAQTAVSAGTDNNSDRSAFSSGKSPGRAKKSKKIKVKMASLVSKMVQKLVSDNVIARERILVTTTRTQLFVRILTTDRSIPTLIMRCERIGVGNVVGAVFVNPIELAVVPTSLSGDKAKNLLDLNVASADNSNLALTEPHHRIMPSDEMDLAELNRLNIEDQTASGYSSDDDSALSIGGSEYSFIEEEASNTKDSDAKDLDDLEEGTTRKRDKTKKLLKEVKEAQRHWVEIASRMRIEQVLQEVTVGASFSFDFVMYTLVAAWIAGFGLAQNSSAILIASMLVSPLMGPVMGMTFGTMVREWRLVWVSFRNEALSLLLCVFIGFIISLIFLADAFDKTHDQWPTTEMTARGEPLGLIYGLLIALPSGMAVALSTLGKNSAGLTGVAISLSLLPPAVNAGLCWCNAILVNKKLQDPSVLFPELYPGQIIEDMYGCDIPLEMFCNATNTCLPTADGECESWGSPGSYTVDYIEVLQSKAKLWNNITASVKHQAEDYAVDGTISFVLTILNIVCIWFGGCFMFWLKEVVPIRSKNTFWTHDIKAYRMARRNGSEVAATKSEIEAIDKGIRASMILNENVSKSHEPQLPAQHKMASTGNLHASTGSINPQRGDFRRAYASNALEDALFAGNVDPYVSSRHFTKHQYPHRREAMDLGGLASIYEGHEEDSLAKERRSLLQAARRIPGGLPEARSVLFSSSLDDGEANFDTSNHPTEGKHWRPSFAHWRNVFSNPTIRSNQDDVALSLESPSL